MEDIFVLNGMWKAMVLCIGIVVACRLMLWIMKLFQCCRLLFFISVARVANVCRNDVRSLWKLWTTAEPILWVDVANKKSVIFFHVKLLFVVLGKTDKDSDWRIVFKMSHKLRDCFAVSTAYCIYKHNISLIKNRVP